MNIEVIKVNLIRLGQSPYIHIFFVSVMLDIMVGTCKSFILGGESGTSSSVGLKGLLKHSLVIMVTIIVSFYLVTFGYDMLAKMFISFFIVQYVVSLTESWGELGLPLPSWVTQRLAKLHDNLDKGVGLDDK